MPNMQKVSISILIYETEEKEDENYSKRLLGDILTDIGMQ